MYVRISIISYFFILKQLNTIGLIMEILHDALWIPYNGILVKIFCWVEPNVELLLSISFPLRVHISVDDIRLSTQVSQELEINLVMVWPFRR